MALRSRTRSARLLVVTLVSLSLLTITIDYRQGSAGPLASAGRVSLALISPLQEAVSRVTHPIGNFFSAVVHLPSLRGENERLKDEVAALRSELVRSTSDQARLKEMEDLLQLKESLALRTTSALVIGSGISNFEWTVTIDKGSGDGLDANMPVVASAGLVGHVVRVAPGSSIVQLIIDPDSDVAGRLVESRETGLLAGQGEQDLRMHLIDPSTEVMPGQSVETAGYKIPGIATGLYPPGIPIGTVSRVLPDPSALERFVTVRPAVDFSTLDFVLVVVSDGSG